MNEESKERVFVIGIAGPSQCGKSTLAINLSQHFDCLNLTLDWFFKMEKDLPETQNYLGKTIKNHECPDSIDWEMLKNNEGVGIHAYKKMSKKILIVEGFLLFVHKEIADLFDIKIWIDCKKEDGCARRVRKQKGSEDEFFSKEYYEHNVWGNYLKTREIQLKNAGKDVIILNSSNNTREETLEIALKEIKTILSQTEITL